MAVVTACSTRVLPASIEHAAPHAGSTVTHELPTGGQLSIASLFPTPGSTLIESSVIDAEFDYRIVNRSPSATYGIAPFFADKVGAGRSFSALRNLTSLLPLNDVSGHIKLHYAIRTEWGNERLAHPPVLWFDLIERTGAGTTRVVVEVGPFAYQ